MTRRQSTCRACSKPVVFATVGNKEGLLPSSMPLNPDPDPDGNVAVYRDAAGRLVGRVVGKGGGHLGYERLMMPHFATCDKRGEEFHGDVTPGVTSIDDWRKARSAHAKAKRSRRGTRPAPQITGIRIYPGRQP